MYNYVMISAAKERTITMDFQALQIFAGFSSSSIFIASNLPMVHKALRTRNLRSYSLGQIALANLGNLIHWIYVSGLPMGPIWALHTFNTLVTVLMLVFYLRYEGFPRAALGTGALEVKS